MKIGEFQNLKISSFADFGIYLIDDDNNKVLLPKKYVPHDCKINDTINVFVYKDSEGRLISTTKKPFLCVGEVAKLTVNDVNANGAFLNIGLERDLFLPFSEQIKKVAVGDKVDVLMYVDKSNRLCATTYINNKNISRKVKNKYIREYEYEQNAELVYKTIKTRFKGHLIYTDKTATSEQIKSDFDLSKNTFKKSIGKLLKDNKIKITNKGIFVY